MIAEMHENANPKPLTAPPSAGTHALFCQPSASAATPAIEQDAREAKLMKCFNHVVRSDSAALIVTVRPDLIPVAIPRTGHIHLGLTSVVTSLVVMQKNGSPDLSMVMLAAWLDGAGAEKREKLHPP